VQHNGGAPIIGALAHHLLHVPYALHIHPGHDPNNNSIIYMAYDVFNPGVICKELNRIMLMVVEVNIDIDKVDNKPKDEPKNKPNVLFRGKYFTMFIFQIRNGKQTLVYFTVARYALEKHSSRWRRRTNRSVVSLLRIFHMYIIGNAYNRTSEIFL
jgi:hypothetical protein